MEGPRNTAADSDSTDSLSVLMLCSAGCGPVRVSVGKWITIESLFSLFMGHQLLSAFLYHATCLDGLSELFKI